MPAFCVIARPPAAGAGELAPRGARSRARVSLGACALCLASRTAACASTDVPSASRWTCASQTPRAQTSFVRARGRASHMAVATRRKMSAGALRSPLAALAVESVCVLEAPRLAIKFRVPMYSRQLHLRWWTAVDDRRRLRRQSMQHWQHWQHECNGWRMQHSYKDKRHYRESMISAAG